MASIFHPRHPEHEPRLVRPGEVRWMLGRNIWTGVLGNIGLTYLTGGVLFVAYCQEMGMQEYHFGALNVLASLMTPLMLLSPVIEERYGRRKYPWFMLSVASRLMLAPMVLGLFFPVKPWVILAVVTLYTALAFACSPLWLSWTLDYIPMPVYARFSARRTFWISLCGMLVFLACAGVVGLTVAGTAARRQLVSAIFVLLLIIGIADLLFHVRIPEPPRKTPRADIVTRLVAPLRSPAFRRWLLVMGVWELAVSLAGPFCVPYMMAELGFSNRLLLASVMTSVVPTVCSLATLRLWGRLLDTRHTASVTILCCAVWSLIPLLYYYATPQNGVWTMGVVWVISGIFPTAVTLALPLVTARLSGLDKTTPAALRPIAMNLGAAMGSAVGIVILRTWGVHHVFMVSFVARLAATLLMFLLIRAPSSDTVKARGRAGC